MPLSIIKPIVSTTGTLAFILILMACNGLQANSSVSQSTISGESHGSMIIEDNDSESFIAQYSSDEQPTYVIDGIVYEWDDLSIAQQERLNAIQAKMKKSKEQFVKFEQALQPLLEDIDVNTQQIEKMVALMQPELAKLNVIEGLTLMEIQTHAKSIESIMREKQAEIRLHEMNLRAKERKIRQIEMEFLGTERQIEKDLNKHVQQIIEVIQKG